MIFGQHLAVFYKESESEVKKFKILEPGGKKNKKNECNIIFFYFYLLFLIHLFLKLKSSPCECVNSSFVCLSYLRTAVWISSYRSWPDVYSFSESEKKYHDLLAFHFGLNIRVSACTTNEIKESAKEVDRRKIGFKINRN